VLIFRTASQSRFDALPEQIASLSVMEFTSYKLSQAFGKMVKMVPNYAVIIEVPEELLTVLA
jgi:hypothetical protein